MSSSEDQPTPDRTPPGGETPEGALGGPVSGIPHSADTLLPLVYKELRALASDQLSRRPGHTIQPTALVHEAYIKMAGREKVWASREHFMATAATAMRHVLVDRLRRKSADKRGGEFKRAEIDVELLADNAGAGEGGGAGLGIAGLRVLELDELLSELAKADPRAAAGAEMRLFGGMEQSAIALVQGVSRAAVAADWQFARAWLAARMHDTGDDRRRQSGGADGA